MDFKQFDSWYAHQKLSFSWKHWQCHFLYSSYVSWTNVSFATLLSTFLTTLLFDAWKCINYCTHCRNLKCIHYYSFNFRLFIFDHKGNSVCETIKTFNPSEYKCWYTSSIFLDNKHSHTISCQESHEKLVSYTSYMWYCVVWSILNKAL